MIKFFVRGRVYLFLGFILLFFGKGYKLIYFVNVFGVVGFLVVLVLNVNEYLGIVRYLGKVFSVKDID